MKGNIKKVTVFVIIAAIAMFVAVGMASAADRSFPKAMRGVYAAIGNGSCLLAPAGFTEDFTPNFGIGVISVYNRVGYFTFEQDGTGLASLNGSLTNFPYTIPNLPPTQVLSSAASATISWGFKYIVTKKGIITITQDPDIPFETTFTAGPRKGLTYNVVGVSFEGTITPDGKTITLSGGGAPNVTTLYGFGLPPNGAPQVCFTNFVLTWQHDVIE
jgi:hypothetical protein